jgi:hypothetical protein
MSTWQLVVACVIGTILGHAVYDGIKLLANKLSE